MSGAPLKQSNRKLHFDNLSNPTKLRFSNASRTSDISSNSITFDELSSPYIGKENYESQLKSLRNQLKCAELSIIQLKSQLREKDLRIEELNHTIHQISQNKVNPTELFLNTPLEKSIISPFQPQESIQSRPSRASIQNTLKSFPRPHLFDDSSMESNTDGEYSSRHLNPGMEIEEEVYTTPQTNTTTSNRLSNPIQAAQPPPFLTNLHTPSPQPISSLAQQLEYSSDNNIDIDNVDPDNMTYDELIQLGQRLGDVATEQWKSICKPIINSLPLHKWLDDDDDNDECTICTTKYILGEFIRELPCKHFYHKECIDEWLSNHKFCPLCKKNIIESP